MRVAIVLAVSILLAPGASTATAQPATPGDTPDVDAWLERSRSRDPAERAAAVEAFSDSRARPRIAERLRELAADDEEAVRVAAIRALAQEPVADASLPVLAAALEDEATQPEALGGLWHAGVRARPWIDRVLATGSYPTAFRIDGPGTLVHLWRADIDQRLAALLIRRLPNTQLAVAAVLLLDHVDPAIRARSLAVLPRTLPGLYSLRLNRELRLGHRQRLMPQGAWRSLLGVVRAFRAAVLRPTYPRQAGSAGALLADAVVRRIGRALSDPEPRVRIAALAALARVHRAGRIGPHNVMEWRDAGIRDCTELPAFPRVPASALDACLLDPDPAVRRRARLYVPDIAWHQKGLPGVGALLALAASDDPCGREWACDALAEASAVGLMGLAGGVGALGHDDPRVRYLALHVLANRARHGARPVWPKRRTGWVTPGEVPPCHIGPVGWLVVAAVAPTLDDPEENVRGMAVVTLGACYPWAGALRDRLLAIVADRDAPRGLRSEARRTVEAIDR